MSKLSNSLLVAAGLFSNVYAMFLMDRDILIPGFGGRYQYLTILGVVMTSIALALRLLNLSTGYFKGLYNTAIAVAAPLETFIFLIYWPIVLYNRELLAPKGTPTYDISLLLDLLLHFIPAVVMLIDFLVYNKGFQRSPKHILAIYGLAMGYFVWVSYCFEQNGVWVYPMLGAFTEAQRGAFFLASGFAGALIYKAIVNANNMIHADEGKKKQE